MRLSKSDYLEPERFRHSAGEIVHCHRDVDVYDLQFQLLRLVVQTASEHGIALEEVAEGALRIARLPNKSPLKPSPAIEHRLTERGSRQQPDGLTMHGEERLYEVWQHSKAFGDHTSVLGQAKQVFDDHAKPLSPEPVERLKHDGRGSAHPSLVHVHRHELMQKGAGLRCAPLGVIGHHVVSRVILEAVLSRNPTRDRRFARTASATNPVDVSELLVKFVGIGTSFVPSGLQSSAFLRRWPYSSDP